MPIDKDLKSLLIGFYIVIDFLRHYQLLYYQMSREKSIAINFTIIYWRETVMCTTRY